MILLEKLTQIRRSEMSENGAKIFIYNNHKSLLAKVRIFPPKFQFLFFLQNCDILSNISTFTKKLSSYKKFVVYLTLKKYYIFIKF